MLRARPRPPCNGQGYCRACRARFRWAFPGRWYDAARTSTAFAVGPSISIPIFEGGQLRGGLVLRESRQREAAIFFQKTVLRAWKEVDDALTAYREAQLRRAEN